MPPRHSRDEQPRVSWPLNEAGDRSKVTSRLRSRPEAGSEAGVAVAAPPAPPESATEGRADAPAGDALDEPRRGDSRPGTTAPRATDFATYVQEQLRREGRGSERDGPDSFERVGLGTLYRSGEMTTHDRVDDNVLGLNYSTVAPRAFVGDDGWARSLRSFAQAAVWLMPAGVVLLALSSVFGVPTATSEPQLVSAGTWVVVTTLGLGLWLLGVVALAALVATSRARGWAIVAVVASALGVALVGPLIGVSGLARPAVTRTAQGVENDPNIADAAARMQQGMLDHAAGRWLIFAGGVLLALGALAVVFTILGSRVLQRHDAWLMLVGVGLAIVAASLAWDFLFTLGAMVVLAATLGLAYTASRIAPDGTPPPAY